QPERHALARDRVLGVAPADVAEAGGPQRRAAHDVARETREAVAAADARHRADAIALAPGPVRSAGALPDRGDLARELVTHHGTARDGARELRHVEIRAADAAALDAQQHLPRPRRRIRNLHDRHGLARLDEARGAHR